jgi:hypothetical protein
MPTAQQCCQAGSENGRAPPSSGTDDPRGKGLAGDGPNPGTSAPLLKRWPPLRPGLPPGALPGADSRCSRTARRVSDVLAAGSRGRRHPDADASRDTSELPVAGHHIDAASARKRRVSSRLRLAPRTGFTPLLGCNDEGPGNFAGLHAGAQKYFGTAGIGWSVARQACAVRQNGRSCTRSGARQCQVWGPRAGGVLDDLRRHLACVLARQPGTTMGNFDDWSACDRCCVACKIK